MPGGRDARRADGNCLGSGNERGRTDAASRRSAQRRRGVCYVNEPQRDWGEGNCGTNDWRWKRRRAHQAAGRGVRGICEGICEPAVGGEQVESRKASRDSCETIEILPAQTARSSGSQQFEDLQFVLHSVKNNNLN